MDEEIGLTCLYKNGEAKNFIGDEVRQAESEGWKDTPQPKEEPKKEEPKEAPPSLDDNTEMEPEDIEGDSGMAASGTTTQEQGHNE